MIKILTVVASLIVLAGAAVTAWAAAVNDTLYAVGFAEVLLGLVLLGLVRFTAKTNAIIIENMRTIAETDRKLAENARILAETDRMLGR